MFVKFELSTGYSGMDETVIYHFPDDTSDADIDEYGHDLAMDNAESFGCFDNEDYNEDDVECSWEELKGYTEEQIRNEFGDFEEAYID